MKKLTLTVLLIISTFAAGSLLLSKPVEAAELPQVENVRISIRGERFVKIRWKRVARASHYRVLLLSKNKKKLRNLRANRATKKIKKLRPGRVYYVQVRARRRVKKGPWSKQLRVRTRPDYSPVIKNLIVDFDDWDQGTDEAGAFIFSGAEEKVFYEFGAVVEGPGGEKILPTFEYRLSEEADVYSPIDGYVQTIFYQDSTDDYEVLIYPVADLDLAQEGVSVDHLTNITVEEGDAVSAGDVLGNPGTWNGELGRTELMIWGDKTYCPFKFFAPKLKARYEQKVWQHMEDWENFKYDDTIYDQDTMEQYGAGCLANSYNE